MPNPQGFKCLTSRVEFPVIVPFTSASGGRSGTIAVSCQVFLPEALRPRVTEPDALRNSRLRLQVEISYKASGVALSPAVLTVQCAVV